MNLVKILLAGIQPLTQAGLKYIIQRREDMDIVDKVANRAELLSKLQKYLPTVLIMDYQEKAIITPSEFGQLFRASPNTQVLVISDEMPKPAVLQILETGVTGYLNRASTELEIMNAIYTVAKGEKYFCNNILELLLERRSSPAVYKADKLSEREREVLKLIVEGNSTHIIADKLNLSHHTVSAHRKNIIKKLGTKSPTEFAMYAIKTGIVQIES